MEKELLSIMKYVNSLVFFPIQFFNQLANIHQRLKHAKDQEGKCRIEIEQSQQELNKMRVC